MLNFHEIVIRKIWKRDVIEVSDATASLHHCYAPGEISRSQVSPSSESCFWTPKCTRWRLSNVSRSSIGTQKHCERYQSPQKMFRFIHFLRIFRDFTWEFFFVNECFLISLLNQWRPIFLPSAGKLRNYIYSLTIRQ
jgi:hypothetical protein